MPLFLSNVTLVIIDSVAHELSGLALNNTLDQIRPKATIIVSDDPTKIMNQALCQKQITSHVITLYQHETKSLNEVAQFLWYELPSLIHTSHLFIIQYDGFVLDSSMWQDSWLEYDYIGAPWPWHDRLQVGNGGFSLRSTKLMQFLCDNAADFPLRKNFPEDDLLCRIYRPELEALGFRWPKLDLASQFSFEREPPRRSFGFHGAWNFAHVLTSAQLHERQALASAYIKGTIGWRELEANLAQRKRIAQ